MAAKFPTRPKLVIHICLLITLFLTSSYQVDVDFNARACNGFCGNQLKIFGDNGSNSVFHMLLFGFLLMLVRFFFFFFFFFF